MHLLIDSCCFYKYNIRMKESIEAVAFDIDGTLYPSWSLYVRLIPYFVRNIRFFLHYNAVRKILHRTAPLADFYEYQGRLLAERLHISAEDAKSLIDDKVYGRLSPYFDSIKPFRHAAETVRALKEAGLKIAILSDFPPHQKGNVWGIADLCDVILGSEETGALKPSLYAFGMLSHALGVPREKILYVGNSMRCDVFGAKNAGMKVAFKMGFWRALLRRGAKDADINFYSYCALRDAVLKGSE